MKNPGTIWDIVEIFGKFWEEMSKKQSKKLLTSKVILNQQQCTFIQFE